MKMKRMFIAVLTLVTFAMLAGCNNLEETATVAGGDGSGELRTVPIDITNIPTDYQAMVASGVSDYGARTILPDSPYDTSSSGLYWVLTGSTSTGKTYAGHELTLTSASGSSATAQLVALESFVWELTLTVYKTRTGDSAPYTYTDPVLIGYSSLDLRAAASGVRVTFNMIKTGLSTQGSVYVTGSSFVDGIAKEGQNTNYTQENGVVEYYDIGLYDRIKGTPIDGATWTVKKTGSTVEGITTSYTYSYGTGANVNIGELNFGSSASPITVDPGTYLFAVTFYNSNKIAVGYYSDFIIVDPGNTTIITLGTINVINQKPDAPSDFKAYLVNDSEGLKKGYYKVRFEWVDKSSNETNFEIELLEAGGAAPRVAVNNASWNPSEATTSTGNYTYVPASKTWTYTDASTTDTAKIYGLHATNAFASDIYGGSDWVSGTLRAGSKSLTMYLALGKVYETRIRAINSSGASAWVERSNAASASTILTTTTPYGYDSYASDELHINRLQLTYTLNGTSTLYLAGESHVSQYIVYDTYRSSASDTDYLLGVTYTDPTWGTSITAYNSESPSYPSIQSTLGDFIHWADATDSTDSPLYVHDYKNLEIKAIYDFTANINVSAYKDLSKELIQLAIYKDSACDSGDLITNTVSSDEWEKGVAYSKDYAT